MNSPQQVAAVRSIIKIKNKILHSTDWDDIADMVQNAIDIASTVPANDALDPLDRTKTKGWNIISLKRLIASLREKGFTDLETAYPEVAASLLKLSMVFVEGGLDDVNKILADSLLTNGVFGNKRSALSGRS